jgi:hypothetical protein
MEYLGYTDKNKLYVSLFFSAQRTTSSMGVAFGIEPCFVTYCSSQESLFLGTFELHDK